jgi:hypothetical protein
MTAGSAIPDWPADVTLLSDPSWTRDYAATVRRLVRDGVDVPLARLFVEAAHSRLEVDLLCAGARIAIEIDGPHHLADPVAYRRDRLKDRLLQEQGYFVLRFLAEDVAKDLDTVLDVVLRSLASHRR